MAERKEGKERGVLVLDSTGGKYMQRKVQAVEDSKFTDGIIPGARGKPNLWLVVEVVVFRGGRHVSLFVVCAQSNGLRPAARWVVASCAVSRPRCSAGVRPATPRIGPTCARVC